MYTIIQNCHSGWAYLALLLLIIVLINAIIGLSTTKEFTDRDRKLGLFGLIGAHIQLLFGLMLYFVSPLGFSNIAQLGMGAVMKNPDLRLTVIEHPVTNIIAIVLITIGWLRHKRLEMADSKFKSFLIFYGLGLLLLLSRIPWKLWL